jgi:hypothetical protein
MSDEHSPVSLAAAELADLRARARAIMTNRFLTPTARVAMLRDHEAAMVVALRRWRALSGIAPVSPSVPNTARGGRYRAW